MMFFEEEIDKVKNVKIYAEELETGKYLIIIYIYSVYSIWKIKKL